MMPIASHSEDSERHLIGSHEISLVRDGKESGVNCGAATCISDRSRFGSAVFVLP